jgi:CubicO group peptidase (beta-lactamase class C family)
MESGAKARESGVKCAKRCFLVISAALIGLWAATQAPLPLTNQWIQPASGPWPRYAIAATPLDETMHYFLVVTRDADGTLRAFIRNPELNAGVLMGTRILLVERGKLIFHASGKPDMFGSTFGSTLAIDGFPSKDTTTTFHRPSAVELRWYFPRPTSAWVYRQPTPTDDGWSVGALAEVGLRESPIAKVMHDIVSLRSPVLRSPYIQSVAIARHGRLVLDEYFYGFTTSTPHDVRSAGKSVTTLLVGRAIEDTHRFTPQTPVLSFLPQYLPVANDDPRKRRMTVANLMTMSSGLACDDNDDGSPGNEDTMQAQAEQPDWYKYALDLPMQYDPGSRAVYCTAGINLLGAIVGRAVGMPLEQYFYERFALPMQFRQYAMWLMPAPTNAAYMGGGDYFRPRDFLKFGQLFLSHGMWNGRQILDDGWLRESVVQRTVMNEDAAGEGDRYGYGWHLATLVVDGERYGVIDAGGNGGQIMAVVPELDMAVMITAGNYNQYPVWSSFLERVVGAAIRAATSS